MTVGEASLGEANPVLVLRKVGFLSGLDDETLLELFARSELRSYAAGSPIVSELESGADVFVVVRGEAEVSVVASEGRRQVVGTLGPGHAFGEMSSITGELRSATVTALAPVEVLVIPDREFDRLRERRPEVALALVRVLAERVGQIDREIDQFFTIDPTEAPAPAARVRRVSVARVWRELVVARRRNLAFLTLAAFVLTLVAVRLTVYLAFRYDVSPRGVLRAAYMTGFAALIGSACASLLTFRPSFRRAIAALYGVGVALIFNELGVTLAFDIFFKDIHTPDPNIPFDIEKLYERATAMHAIVLGLVVLVQAAYLRRFYARTGFMLMTQARRIFSRRDA